MLALLAASSLQAQTLKPGDLAFTTYNADQDGWAIVALVDLAPQTSVFFTDNPWDGSGAFAAGGGFERWVSGSAKIGAGSVVQFSYIDDAWKMQASVGTLTREAVAGSSYLNLSQTAGTLYAYQGSSAIQPSVFITAVSNGGFDVSVGALAGTGLAAGVNALQLSQGADFAEFDGVRTTRLSADGYRSVLNSPANWAIADGGQYASQLSNAAPLASLVVPEPGALLLALAGALTLAAARRASASPSPLGAMRPASWRRGGTASAHVLTQRQSSRRPCAVRQDQATPSDRGPRVRLDQFAAPETLHGVTVAGETSLPRAA